MSAVTIALQVPACDSDADVHGQHVQDNLSWCCKSCGLRAREQERVRQRCNKNHDGGITSNLLWRDAVQEPKIWSFLGSDLPCTSAPSSSKL